MKIGYYDVAKAVALIKEFEGLRLQAYRCSANKLTIGYGHTDNVKDGQVITKAQAESLLASDVREHAAYVNAINNVRISNNMYALSNNQYSALLVLAFNIPAALSLKSSTLAKLIVQSADLRKVQHEIKTQWLRWCYVSSGKAKVKSKGLLLRRETELDLFFCNR